MAAVGRTSGARRLAERLRVESRAAGRSQPASPGPTLAQLRSWVIHREPDLVLINKPQGLPTHGEPYVY
uniref:Uncharacterized protein n=1 Tax=Pyxicephalus adspersus TaxID=30357 RepID=A0AAV3A354_PYXAD|nr:TPA: hypothetical protein GDO54_014739 [Pyxicephalus adspersus]